MASHKIYYSKRGPLLAATQLLSRAGLGRWARTSALSKAKSKPLLKKNQSLLTRERYKDVSKWSLDVVEALKVDMVHQEKPFSEILPITVKKPEDLLLPAKKLFSENSPLQECKDITEFMHCYMVESEKKRSFTEFENKLFFVCRDSAKIDTKQESKDESHSQAFAGILLSETKHGIGSLHLLGGVNYNIFTHALHFKDGSIFRFTAKPDFVVYKIIKGGLKALAGAGVEVKVPTNLNWHAQVVGEALAMGLWNHLSGELEQNQMQTQWIYRICGHKLSVARIDFPKKYFGQLTRNVRITEKPTCKFSPQIDLLVNLEEGLCVLESMADFFQKTT